MVDQKQVLHNVRSVLIVTHFFTSGPPQALRDFLVEKISRLAYIEHPFSYCENTQASVTVYSDGYKKRTFRLPQMYGPDFFFYIKDFFLTVIAVLCSGIRFDMAIAADNLNALSCICLRMIGRVKRVIYFTIDYTPVRFQNRLLNFIYHRIDRFCCYRADLMWNDSQLMQAEREKAGLRADKIAYQMVVTGGNYFHRVKRYPVNQIDMTAIAYMGHIHKRQGLDLVIESLPQLIEKISKIKFVIIGKGAYLNELKKRAKALRVDNHIDFKGYVKDLAEVERILSKCSIGIAPYYPDPSSYAQYSDAGKPRIYMACGLPVIITSISSLAKNISENKTGISINYSKEEFTAAILNLLNDQKMYNEYRDNAIEFASNFDWSNIFKAAFNESLERLNITDEIA